MLNQINDNLPSLQLTEEIFCIHSIIKTQCKTCIRKCIHSKQKSRCVDCGGTSICIHNKERYRCKECSGKGICIHSKRKTSCMECDGASICTHGKFKPHCKSCVGGSICQHGNRKSRCVECGGSEFCIHGKQKSRCVDCGGTSICIHGKRRSGCRDCNGSEFCIHSKRKTSCRYCNGTTFCIHNKRKSRCKCCGGSSLCKSTYCETIKHPKCDGYCMRCYIWVFPDNPISRNYKTKEYAVLEFIRNNFSEYNWINNRVVDGGCSKKRPDILLDLLTHIIIIEIDENQHKTYDNCELGRMTLLSEDLGFRPIIFIRFNPDMYINKDGIRVPSCWSIDKNGLSSVKKSKIIEWSNRLETLKNKVNSLLNIDDLNVTSLVINEYIFYDENV